MAASVRQCIVAAVTALAAWTAQAQVFRADGPEADQFGRNRGYPACPGLTYLGDPACRVHAFSHFDTLYAAHPVPAGTRPSPLARSPREPEVPGLQEYLSRYPVTALLVARGDTILVERYQYARRETQRLTSFSMAKTITALLVGLAVSEGRIRSIDEPAAAYAASLQDTEFGRTPIRALLQMSSGIAFDESYANPSSDIYRLATEALSGRGSAAALKVFGKRSVPPGQRFSYSSADTLALGLVLSGALPRPLAAYASEKLWAPLGAEAAASWIVDGTGQLITFAYYNAVLRDWARLGLMLAHGGSWNGTQVIPKDWIEAMQAPGASPGYGYQLWILPTPRPTYKLQGLRGQYVLYDPATKTVLVQTSLRADPGAEPDLLAIWRRLIGER